MRLREVLTERNELLAREARQRDVLQRIHVALFPKTPAPLNVDLVLEIQTRLAELERLRGCERDLNCILMLMAVGNWCCTCGAPATCFGGYEDSDSPGFSCDDCCGHACEDGWCIQLPEICARCDGEGEIVQGEGDELEQPIPCPDCSGGKERTEKREPPEGAH